MSEHEVTDEAGRIWIFSRQEHKTWETVIGGDLVRLSGDVGYWRLLLPDQLSVDTNESLISNALKVAQPYLAKLDGKAPAGEFVPSTQSIRRAFANTHTSLGGEAFDRWLAQHDQELIDALNSVKEVMKA